MTTRSHFGQDERCPDQELLVSILYDEFDESEAADRRRLTRHVETCERCARVLASLGGVRQRLRAWEVPDTAMPLAFRIASGSASRAAAGATPGWGGWMKAAFPLAAAATLVLGAALGLARLDVQYDKSGFHLTTGWNRGPSPATVATTVPNPPVNTAGVVTFLSPGSDQNRSVTQQDIQLLAQTLRQEIAASAARLQAQDAAARGSSPAAVASEAAFFKRVEQLIDQAEVRSQGNLNLRITEVQRAFNLQLSSQAAMMEQGFGKLGAQREVDAQQQRLLLNAIRTSQTMPVAPR